MEELRDWAYGVGAGALVGVLQASPNLNLGSYTNATTALSAALLAKGGSQSARKDRVGAAYIAAGFGIYAIETAGRLLFGDVNDGVGRALVGLVINLGALGAGAGGSAFRESRNPHGIYYLEESKERLQLEKEELETGTERLRNVTSAQREYEREFTGPGVGLGAQQLDQNRLGQIRDRVQRRLIDILKDAI